MLLRAFLAGQASRLLYRTLEPQQTGRWFARGSERKKEVRPGNRTEAVAGRSGVTETPSGPAMLQRAMPGRHRNVPRRPPARNPTGSVGMLPCQPAEDGGQARTT